MKLFSTLIALFLLSLTFTLTPLQSSLVQADFSASQGASQAFLTSTVGQAVTPYDYGDAPDPPYPSRSASLGAHHLDSSYEWMGYWVDTENDSMQINVDAFDDGVFLGSLFFRPWQTNTLWVLVTVKDRNDPNHPYDANHPLYINVLVDWNVDGQWGGSVSGPAGTAYEWAVRNFAIDVSKWPAGVNSMMVQLPSFLSGPVVGFVWTRITLTYNEPITVSDWDGRGTFQYGETEDYGPWMLSKPPPSLWPWPWWPWWPLPPCCWFKIIAVPKAVQLTVDNPTAAITLVRDPRSTCWPTSWLMRGAPLPLGIQPPLITTNPPSGRRGVGMPPPVTITWQNPCKIGGSRVETVTIRIRGSCRVQTLKIYVSLICGIFGELTSDVCLPFIMCPSEGEEAVALGDPVTPIVAVANYGAEPSGPTTVYCEIADFAGNVVYENYVEVEGLKSGDAVDVEFPEWTPEEEGHYFMRFHALMEGDENPENNYVEKELFVLSPPPMDWTAEICMNKAEDAINQAEEEGRTEGLEEAWNKLADAQDAYNAGNYTGAALLSWDAWTLAMEAVAPFQFSVSAEPYTLSVEQGGDASYELSVSLLSGTAVETTLSLSGLPENATYTFTPPSGVPPYTATLTIHTTGDTPAGKYTLTITASGGGKTSTTNVDLTVEEAPPPPPPQKKCIIATATYGSELAPEVQFLRGFRDNIVLSTFAGSCFMQVFNAWYYSFSPQVAGVIAVNPTLRGFIRLLLYPLIGILHLSAMTYQPFSFNPELGVVMAGFTASALIGIVYLAPPLTAIIMTLRRLGLTKKLARFRVKPPPALPLLILPTLLLLIFLGGVFASPGLTASAAAAFVLTSMMLPAVTVSIRVADALK